MKSYRLGLLLIIFLMLAFAFFQVGGFALDNPTGRRLSSNAVAITGPTTVEVGDGGERTLANDLRLPRNDSAAGERVCICASQSALSQSRRCHTAPVISRTVNSCHIPDFVTQSFIAEAKNVTSLQLTNQLRSFILMAERLNVPLWIYVRIDTRVSATLTEQVKQTGGDIIPYFHPDGYIDEAMISGLVIGLMAIVMVALIIFYRPARKTSPTPEDPPTPLDDLEDAVQSIRIRSRRTIDQEDSRH